jgi:hypothetical protein
MPRSATRPPRPAHYPGERKPERIRWTFAMSLNGLGLTLYGTSTLPVAGARVTSRMVNAALRHWPQISGWPETNGRWLSCDFLHFQTLFALPFVSVLSKHAGSNLPRELASRGPRSVPASLPISERCVSWEKTERYMQTRAQSGNTIPSSRAFNSSLELDFFHTARSASSYASLIPSPRSNTRQVLSSLPSSTPILVHIFIHQHGSRQQPKPTAYE